VELFDGTRQDPGGELTSLVDLDSHAVIHQIFAAIRPDSLRGKPLAANSTRHRHREKSLGVSPPF
jgi:hypothetical protein